MRSAGFLGNDHTLTTVVRGSTVHYDLELPAHASTYRLTIDVEPRRLTFDVERTSAVESVADGELLSNCNMAPLRQLCSKSI